MEDEDVPVKVSRNSLRSLRSLQSLQEDSERPSNLATAEHRTRRSADIRQSELDRQDITYNSDLQRRVHEFMRHRYYEPLIGAVVVFNIALMWLDVDSTLACDTESCSILWMEVADYVLLVIYTVDLLGALFARRRAFFNHGMNLLDLTIVVLGYVEILATILLSSSSGLGVIRLFRIARLIRIQKLLRPIPELYSLLISFVATIRAIFWGFVMIMLQLIVWSVVILQLKGIIVDENAYAEDDRFGAYWCEDAMSSTWNMILLLWQTLITGDSWGACMLPLILRYPVLYWLFAAVFVCISIGFQNLILAVIVERANNKIEEDRLLLKLKEKEDNHLEIEQLAETFQMMDKDGSGALSLEELLNGYDHQPALQTSLLMRFGIDRSDLTELVKCWESTDQGEVEYRPLVEGMLRSERQEENIQIMMLHSSVAKLTAMVRRIEMRISEGDIAQLSAMVKELERRINEGDVGRPGSRSKPWGASRSESEALFPSEATPSSVSTAEPASTRLTSHGMEPLVNVEL